MLSFLVGSSVIWCRQLSFDMSITRWFKVFEYCGLSLILWSIQLISGRLKSPASMMFGNDCRLVNLEIDSSSAFSGDKSSLDGCR
jgi:hypothetical protein